MALMKTTIEQKTMVKGTQVREIKQVFNLWEKQGNKLLELMEGKDETLDDHIEKISDVLHDTVDEIRRQITPKK